MEPLPPMEYGMFFFTALSEVICANFRFILEVRLLLGCFCFTSQVDYLAFLSLYPPLNSLHYATGRRKEFLEHGTPTVHIEEHLHARDVTQKGDNPGFGWELASE